MQTDIGQLEIVRGDKSITIFLFSFFFFLFFRFLFECMSLRGYGAQVLLYSLPVACWGVLAHGRRAALINRFLSRLYTALSFTRLALAVSWLVACLVFS